MRFLFLPWLSPVLSPWLYKPRTGDNLRGVVSFWISGIELLPWLSPVLSPRLYRSRGREIIRGVVLILVYIELLRRDGERLSCVRSCAKAERRIHHTKTVRGHCSTLHTSV